MFKVLKCLRSQPKNQIRGVPPGCAFFQSDSSTASGAAHVEKATEAVSKKQIALLAYIGECIPVVGRQRKKTFMDANKVR